LWFLVAYFTDTFKNLMVVQFLRTK